MSKVSKGDRFRVVVTVLERQSSISEERWLANVPGGDVAHDFSAQTLLASERIPREWKVDDDCQLSDCPSSQATIVGLHEGKAWLRFFGGGYGTYDIAQLEPVE